MISCCIILLQCSNSKRTAGNISGKHICAQCRPSAVGPLANVLGKHSPRLWGRVLAIPMLHFRSGNKISTKLPDLRQTQVQEASSRSEEEENLPWIRMILEAFIPSLAMIIACYGDKLQIFWSSQCALCAKYLPSCHCHLSDQIPRVEHQQVLDLGAHRSIDRLRSVIDCPDSSDSESRSVSSVPSAVKPT